MDPLIASAAMKTGVAAKKGEASETLLGTNQLASRWRCVTNKSLPTRWSHFIRHKQRRCGKFLSIGTLLL